MLSFMRTGFLQARSSFFGAVRPLATFSIPALKVQFMHIKPNSFKGMLEAHYPKDSEGFWAWQFYTRLRKQMLSESTLRALHQKSFSQEDVEYCEQHRARYNRFMTMQAEQILTTIEMTIPHVLENIDAYYKSRGRNSPYNGDTVIQASWPEFSFCTAAGPLPESIFLDHMLSLLMN